MIETGSLHKHHTILYIQLCNTLIQLQNFMGHHKSLCKLENASLTVVLVG